MDDGDSTALLREARALYSQGKLADLLGVDVRTIRRWEVKENEPPAYLADALRQRVLPPSDDESCSSDFTFIELFAGIGGMRLAFERVGGRCIFACEAGDFAQKTYRANFPADHPRLLLTDIANLTPDSIPDHDLLVAALPYRRGVNWAMTWNHLLQVISSKRPRGFVFEIAKQFSTTNQGQALKTMLSVLGDHLGYQVHHQLIDAQYFVPQRRERLIILGFDRPTDFSWDNISLPSQGPRLTNVLHGHRKNELPDPPYTRPDSVEVDPKYTLTEKLWAYQAGKLPANDMPLTGDSVMRALSVRCYKDGTGILVQEDGMRPRRLTPRECARLMGYPDNFQIPVSDTQAYQQFAMGIVVPMLVEVARLVKPGITLAAHQMQSSIG